MTDWDRAYMGDLPNPCGQFDQVDDKLTRTATWIVRVILIFIAIGMTDFVLTAFELFMATGV